MAQYLKAGLARIWIQDPLGDAMQMQATAGPLNDRGTSSGETAKVRLDMEALAHGKPILINNLPESAALLDHDWAGKEKIQAFAAYPLILEETVVGVMEVFGREPFRESILQEMASVANGIAMCIERKRSAEALGASGARVAAAPLGPPPARLRRPLVPAGPPARRCPGVLVRGGDDAREDGGRGRRVEHGRLGEQPGQARDVLGRVYEYFIKGFARAEGHRVANSSRRVPWCA